jgi:predicted phosphodiesterase
LLNAIFSDKFREKIFSEAQGEYAMRLAIFSDIHGNPLALEAVLNAIGGQVDGYIVVGDYCGIGYDPATVVEMLQQLPNAHFVRGNTDRYILTRERPGPSFEKVVANPQLLQTFINVEAQFAWAHGYLVGKGLLSWLDELPLEYRMNLPDGTRVLAVHARPGYDDGDGFHADLSDEELYAMVADSQADLIFTGHYHVPYERVVNGIHCANIASVSNSQTDSPCARYAILEADTQGYTLTYKQAEYDYQAVINRIEASRHPCREFLRSFFEE